MAAMWWLWLADHLGLVGLVALAIGAVALLRKSPRHDVLLLGWWLPVHAGLSMREAWDYPNKMGILLIAAAPWPIWWSAWFALAVRRPAMVAVVLGTGVILLQVALTSLSSWQVPADERYFTRYALQPTESKTHLSWAKQRAFDFGWLPDFSRATRYGSVIDRIGAGKAWQRQSPLAWGWLREDIPPRGQPVVVEFDLRQPLWGAIAMRPVSLPRDATVDIDLTVNTGLSIVPQITVSWETSPLTVAATLGPRLALIEVAFRNYRDRESFCDATNRSCHCRFFDTLDSGAAIQACGRPHVLTCRRPRLTIRLPAGGISLFATVNPAANEVYLWRGRVDAQSSAFGPIVEFWHN
ncbi:MAG: hypothetical protein EXR77_19420 [Myxococcales bacterium]|nr:hypothetical protein [Myxococcales bacterium]